MGAMTGVIRFIIVLIVSFGISVPLGTWRAISKKFSISWFAAIHLAVPIIYYFRVSNDFPYWTIPAFVAASLLGQVAGGSLKGRLGISRSSFHTQIKGE